MVTVLQITASFSRIAATIWPRNSAKSALEQSVSFVCRIKLNLFHNAPMACLVTAFANEESGSLQHGYVFSDHSF